MSGSTAIDGIPATQIIKQYLDGSSIRQYQFVFRTQAYHSLELSEGLANSGFFEDLAAWLEVQTKTGTLPDMEAGKELRKIEAQSTEFLLSNTADSSRYQIQCRLEYYQEA